MLYFTESDGSESIDDIVLRVVNASMRYWMDSELEYRDKVVKIVRRVFDCFPDDMDFRVCRLYNDIGFVITPIYRTTDGSEFELNRVGYIIKICTVRVRTAVKFISPYGRETYVSITNISGYDTFINRVREIMDVPLQVARERAEKIDTMWRKSEEMLRISKKIFPCANIHMYRNVNRALDGLFLTIYIEMDMVNYVVKMVLQTDGLVYIEISNKSAAVADMCRVLGKTLMTVAEKYGAQSDCVLKLYNVTSNLANYSRDMRISFRQDKELNSIGLETYEKYLIEMRDILKVALSDVCGMVVMEGDNDGL